MSAFPISRGANWRMPFRESLFRKGHDFMAAILNQVSNYNPWFSYNLSKAKEGMSFIACVKDSSSSYLAFGFWLFSPFPCNKIGRSLSVGQLCGLICF